MTAVMDRSKSDQTYLPSRELDELAQMRDLLSSIRDRKTQQGARLVDSDGRAVPVPVGLVPALLQVVEAMQAGLAVTIAPHHLTLSTQEAADLLRVSRTTLVRLLEEGAIPFEKPNKHRRVRLDDLMEYRRRQRQAADEALTDMVADSQRLALYDRDPELMQTALRNARARRGAARRASDKPTEELG
jgi:excisionase family DNA binding protein